MQMKTLQGDDLLRFQPNRYPFLFVDRIVDYEPGKFALGTKNFTNNEWFFPVHFPGAPNVPGVIQIEAMAQVTVIAITTIEGLEGALSRGLEMSAKFKKEVLPGDSMTIESNIDYWVRGICKASVVCRVDSQVVSEGRIELVIPQVLEGFKPRQKTE